MDPIIPQPGSARDPAHFVGRSRTTSTATNKLRNGNNLLLNDPRRMGKTYWLSYFVATTPHFAAILIDYEGVRSREAFLLRTVEALRQYQGVESKWGDALRAFFENFDTTVGGGPVKVRVALQQQSPAKLLADTLAAVNEHSPKTVLICMDEVPLAILGIAKAEGAESARELLQTLRLLRQTLSQIRWILAGSVGFHHVLAACKTTEGDLNDLDNLPLGPLTDLEADELARRLLLGIGREPDGGTVETLVERTGGFPYLLQKIASLLDDGNPAPVTPKEVVEAFEDFIDDPDEFRAFAHILTRLEPNYGEDADLARQILDRMTTVENTWMNIEAINPGAVSTRFDGVLEKLASDHYCAVRGTRVRWRYPTLQYIWARRRKIWERPS